MVFCSFVWCFSEILMEEKSAQQETMRRENRRVAAMSWGPSDDLPPPPKPSRYPMQGEFDENSNKYLKCDGLC